MHNASSGSKTDHGQPIACYQLTSTEHQNKSGMMLVVYLFMLIPYFVSGACYVWILLFCLYVCVCEISFVYTGMSVLILVTLHVQGQVVRAWEAAAAGDALEGFGSGVFPVVSGEFVRSGEAPVAALPCTTVRLLACKREDGGVSNEQNFFSHN